MWLRKRSHNRPAICIVRHNYYPDTHVRRDAEALVDAGYDVTVIALRRENQQAREVLRGVNVRRLPVGHRRGSALRYAWEYLSFALLAFINVSTLHLRRRFQVVEVDNMPDILVFSALVPKLTGTPVILYIFDNMPELLAYLWQTSNRHPLVRFLALLERISTSFADRVIVTQEMPRRLTVARGVPEWKLSVVLNCADEAIFHRRGRPTKTDLKDVFTIVTHGTLLKRYGVQTLIEAMPSVIEAIPETCLEIFGEGEYRSELERRVHALDLGGHVRFRGFAPLEDLLNALADANAGYVGMLNDLVLPNKLMEYVSMGVPVVLSRWSTFLHYFPNDSATYFEAGNASDLARALIALCCEPELATARAKQATDRYQQYRWTVQKETYLGLYRDLVTKRAGGRDVEYSPEVTS